MAVTKETPNGLFLVRAGSERYREAQKFTRKHYRRRFGCDVSHDMPGFFNLYEHGRLVAVAGFRDAGETPLFLEQYLDDPVESLLANRLPGVPARSTIVEIGGFAAEDRLAALNLMQQLAPALFDLGFTTVVCTVNRAVRLCLGKLGIASVYLGEADPARLAPGEDWGSYHAGHPVILAGDIESGMRAIAAPVAGSAVQ